MAATRNPVDQRRVRRVAAAVCALALGLALLAEQAVAQPVAQPVTSAAGADAAVVEARQDLAAAQQRAAQLGRSLDAIAAGYEQAWAHHLRLVEELDDAERAVAEARREAEQAQQRLEQRLAGSYRNPHADLALAQAVLDAPDPATAVHRVALVGRLSVRGAAELGARRADAVRAIDARRQQELIASGAGAAAAERQRLAEQLSAALDEAGTAVDRAEHAVAAAEESARRRARELAARAAPPAVVAASVGGKVCPVAGPHGFIDSWGFPRSGGRRHQGVDIFAASGTPLVAVADGVVRRVWNTRLGGLSIDLLDDNGDRYYYAHLSSASAVAGQRVSAGDVIGAVGNSGNARTTPPHLHWQFHPGGGPPVNPYPLSAALCR